MSSTAMDTSESYQRDRGEIERLAYKTWKKKMCALSRKQDLIKHKLGEDSLGIGDLGFEEFGASIMEDFVGKVA